MSTSCTKGHFCPTGSDDVVDLIDCYQYEDNKENDVDAFTREPYILHFKPHNTGQTCCCGVWGVSSCLCMNLFVSSRRNRFDMCSKEQRTGLLVSKSVSVFCMLTDLCHDEACYQRDGHSWLTRIVMVAVLKDRATWESWMSCMRTSWWSKTNGKMMWDASSCNIASRCLWK